MGHITFDSHPLRRALVVDDNPTMRLILSSMLANRGFAVAEENNAEQALERLAHEQFDFVALDILLTGMSGIDLCRLIREKLGMTEVPIIAYTAHAATVSMSHLLLAGFSDILYKPVESAALNRILDRVPEPA